MGWTNGKQHEISITVKVREVHQWIFQYKIGAGLRVCDYIVYWYGYGIGVGDSNV